MILEELDFGFLSEGITNFFIPDEIYVVHDPVGVKGKKFIVANSRVLSPVVYAPEVNFYLRNTQDDVDVWGKNVLALYKLRYLKYTYSTDIPEYKEISNRLLLVGTPKKREVFKGAFEEAERFEIAEVDPDSISFIRGPIGEMRVGFKDESTIVVDQVVWFNAPEDFERVGVYDPERASLEEVKEKVLTNLLNGYEYRKVLRYDSSICQHHERTQDVCGVCADFCPVDAILKVEGRRLQFVEVNCTGCGGCISVCPSGALDYAETSRGVFHMMSKVFRGRISLIVPEVMNIDDLSVELKKNVFPFVVGGRKFLDESHFLTLLQESGSQVVFYNDSVSRGTEEALSMVNEIYRRKYGKVGVLLATTKEELELAIDEASSIDGGRFSIANQMYDKKREIFAKRLEHLVGSDDLGVYHTGEFIHYGELSVDADKCTLCLSCAGGCNVGALIPHEEDGTLRFNASVCTNCGYCELICPEECIEIVDDTLKLNPGWFRERVLAEDEIFRCVECGKPFAPAKSIRKIAEMMIPIFGEDDPRVRTLYCCPECKPKVMLRHHIQQKGKKSG